MYSVSETTEDFDLCVSAHPSIWVVNGNILLWPPGVVNRSDISVPGQNWTPHIMCRVLRTNIGMSNLF